MLQGYTRQGWGDINIATFFHQHSKIPICSRKKYATKNIVISNKSLTLKSCIAKTLEKLHARLPNICKPDYNTALSLSQKLCLANGNNCLIIKFCKRQNSNSLYQTTAANMYLSNCCVCLSISAVTMIRCWGWSNACLMSSSTTPPVPVPNLDWFQPSD